MQIALKLAKRGIGAVEPNPSVGCVIVKNDKIIGKGWHKKFGGPHAEINALADCKKNNHTPADATIYVTLEPCSHYGKTPPCTEAIIATKPARVVIATVDPSKHSNGKGVEQLQNAGIDVEVGLCEDEARLLNAPFFKFTQTGKSWVILKWAQSIDSKLAWLPGSEQRWLSNEKSRKDAHNLRRRADAILVGINTIITDNPLLTPRPAKGKELVRIVLDTKLRTPSDCKLFTTIKQAPVIIVTTRQAVEANPQKKQKIIDKGAEVLEVPAIQNRCDLKSLLDQLRKRTVRQLLVEGGPTVITSFLEQKLADEICIYIAPKILAAQGCADISKPMAQLSKAVQLYHLKIKHFGADILITGLTNSEI